MVDPQPPPEAPGNGATPETLIPGPGSKRQRRPSVRLGDIGEQPASITYEPYVRRSKQWKLHPSSAASSDDPKPRHHPPPKDHLATKTPSKIRPLTNLAPIDDHRDGPDFPPPPPAEDRALIPVDENLEPLAVAIRRGIRDGKARRGGGSAAISRRIRSGWASKVDDGLECPDFKLSGGEDAGDEGYRDDSESLSYRNDMRGTGAAARVRVSGSRDGGPAADMAERDAPSETNGEDRNNRNGRCWSLEDGGVRSWLNRLGLGRYAPVFEIHEVDDEVLPLLTLEDLKDMGINAVGSRRKMHCAIQKLRKAFT